MRKKIALSVCCLVAICLCAEGAWPKGNTKCDLIRKTDAALVNWTDGMLTVTGRGSPPDAYYGDAQGRKIALAAAVKDARKKLLESIEQIPIDTASTVGDLSKNNPAVLVALKQMVGMAEVVHQEYSTDGTVTVTIQMSMNGGFSQLVLPSRIKQIEPVKPIVSSTDAAAGNSASSATTDTPSEPYTGMIIDMRGIRLTPCMAPRICDENGQEVFGPAYASREFAVQHGMTGYLSNLAAAARYPRVAGHPLILKGLRSSGVRDMDIVVSNTDAARLRSAFENLAFLRQCRVLIVVDSPDSSKKG